MATKKTAAKKTAPKKPKFKRIGDSFIAQTSQGELKLSLLFPARFSVATGDMTEQELFGELLDKIATPQVKEKALDLDIVEFSRLVMAYFEEVSARVDEAVNLPLVN